MKRKNMIPSKLRRLLAALLAVLVFTGSYTCNKYLDARPDKSQVVPQTLQDAEALLNNLSVMNRSFGSYGEAASDDYYVTDASFNSLTFPEDKTLYPWKADGQVSGGQWLAPYEVVFYANEVLEIAGSDHSAEAARVRGEALFFRGYAHFCVADLFGQPYAATTAGTDPGVPLRLTADFNARSARSSNTATYSQILGDLKMAAELLPLTSVYPTQPNRVSAYAALARVYLATGSYADAGRYADSCIALGPQLMDYNALDPASPNPFARFNPETLFSALSGGSSLLTSSRCLADTVLYTSYAADDLRKSLFFKQNSNGTVGFKNNYDGEQSSSIFTGIAMDEVYLAAAESAARAGNTNKAMNLLNALLVTRWKQGTYRALTAPDSTAAIGLVLQERRKELVLRGTRWTDLRRLNQETAYQVILTRKLGGVVYTLLPQDKRYALLIPESVIALTGMAQNAR
jgi:tetratricopeptide (TPR) repeat protein